MNQTRHPEPCEGPKLGFGRNISLGSFAALRMTGFEFFAFFVLFVAIGPAAPIPA
jgi:hypothetical protein